MTEHVTPTGMIGIEEWEAVHVGGGGLGEYSVADYGAVGNDTADDTTALQDAIDAAVAGGGGVVSLPPGTYKITTRLALGGLVTLRGAGLKTSVIHAVGCDGLYFNPGVTVWPENEQYIRLQDFGVVGDYTAAKVGVTLAATLRFAIERIAVEQFASHGISLFDTYTDSIRDCLITNNDGDGIHIGSNCLAISIHGGEHRRNNGAGCAIDGTGSGVWNISFFGGVYEDNRAGGIDVRAYSTGISIFGSYFERNNQVNTDPVGRGSFSAPSGDYNLMLASAGTTLRGAMITGCRFAGHGGGVGYDIYLGNTNSVTMMSNTHDGATVYPYYQDPASISYNLRVGAINDEYSTGHIPHQGSSTFNGIAGTYAAYSATLTPGGYWRLGEASGTFADTSGTATGTGTAITYGVTGLLTGDSDKAITMNGTTSRIDLGTNSRYTYGDTCSATAWITRGVTGSTRGIVSRGTGGFYMCVEAASGYLQLRQSQVGIICTSTISIPATTSMVAFTKTGSDVHLYINGSDVTGTVTNLTLTNPSENTQIGCDFGPTHFFNGTIDEVQVYPDVLTPTEVANLYAKGNGASARIITHNIPNGASGPTYQVQVTPTAPVAGSVYVVKGLSTFTVSSTDTSDVGAFDWMILADAGAP